MDLLKRCERLINADQAEVAIPILEDAAKIQRDVADVYYLLGVSRMRCGMITQALPDLMKARRLRPEHAPTIVDLARCLGQLGDQRGARKQVEALLEGWPDHPDGLAQIGQMDLEGGRAQEVVDRLGAVVEASPETADPRLLGLYGRAMRATRRGEDAVGTLRASLKRHDLAPEFRRAVLFALGQILDGMGDYDEAFACFKTANETLQAIEMQPFERYIERWDSEIIRSAPVAAVDGTRAVFVIGMPRSGTTLTDRIIASHPEGGSVGESTAMRELTDTIPMSDTTRIGESYLAGLQQRLGKGKQRRAKRVVDKMPGNFMTLAVAAKALPGSRAVWCLRDPRDICLSQFMQDFGPLQKSSRRLETAAQNFVIHWEFLKRWRETLDYPILEWKYDELVGDTEPRVRALLEFLDLPWHEGCLTPHKAEGSVLTASMSQVREPINAKGLGRWKRYEKHLAPALEILEPVLSEWDG